MIANTEEEALMTSSSSSSWFLPLLWLLLLRCQVENVSSRNCVVLKSGTTAKTAQFNTEYQKKIQNKK